MDRSGSAKTALPCLLFLSAFAACCALFDVRLLAAHERAAGLDEHFSPESSAQWTREPGSSADAIRFPAAGEPLGLACDPALGFGSIWRKVDVGDGPCELACEIEFSRGSAQPWQWPGVVVALASCEPVSMQQDDWALILGAHRQGIRVSAVRRGVYQPREKRPGVWHFDGQEIPKRFEVTQGGAGGHDYSLRWPEKNLAGQRVRLYAAWTPDGKLRFAAAHAAGPGATWWEAECAAPPELANKPLRVVAVRTPRAPSSPSDWTQPLLDPAGNLAASCPAGVVRWIRVGPMLAGQSPQPPVFAESDLPQHWKLDPAPGEVHPSLFGDRDALAAARARLTEPQWRCWRETLRRQGQIGEKSLTVPQIGEKLASCAWAWVLTGDAEARRNALELFNRLTGPSDSCPSRVDGWPGRRRQILELDEFACHNVAGLATAYDLMYEDLSPAQRRAALRVLHRALDYYRDRMRAKDWWYANNPSNTIGVGAGCHGLGALALRHHRPEDAEEVVALAVKAIVHQYAGVADDGGCLEGTLYWQYGTMLPIVFGLALERATGDHRGVLDLPGLRAAGDYARVILGGDGEMTAFNDTQPWLSGLLPLSVGGGRHGDALCLWLVDRMAALAAADSEKPLVGDLRNAGPAFLLRGAAAAPERFPGVPTLAKLDSIAEGVLRSDGGEMPRLLVAVKGNGPRNTHHANMDQGSITLAARGETLLIDPGYFNGGPDCHSLVLPTDADPKSWSPTAPAPLLDAWEEGLLRTMTVDASAAVARLGMKRQRRVVALIADRAVVLLDDLAATQARQPVRVLFQCGGPVERDADGRRARVCGSRADLIMAFDAPDMRLTAPVAREFAKQWVYTDRNQVWQTLAVECAARPDAPVVTILQPVQRDATGEEPAIQRREGSVVVRVAGSELRFRCGDDGAWRLDKR